MMSTHVHMQGTESVIVCVCVYVCIQACVFSLMATAPHFYFYVKVVICWPLIILNMCACVCVCVLWFDPIVWQRWEDEDWSPKNTPGLEWLAEKKRERQKQGEG